MAAKNFRIVHGPSDFFYLVSCTGWLYALSLYCTDYSQDCGAGEWIGDDVAYVVLTVVHLQRTC